MNQHQSQVQGSIDFAHRLLHAAAYLLLLLSAALAAGSQVLNPGKPAPLGTLIDVGGYRVHLYCIGQGSPTVMIVGGAYSFDWGLVQPAVAKFARVCTFDPSGTAWSDPFRLRNSTVSPKSAGSALPTCEDRVEEIHRLITNAPIDGPYVFVGFSVGALWERIYAVRYPANITGMVIVDHAFQGGSGTPAHAARAKSFPGDYSPPGLISKAPMTIGFEDSSNFSKLPQLDQELHTWALSQHPILVDYEMVADCFSHIETMTRGHAHPLGSMRLVVISTQNEAPGYSQLQAKLLALSRNSEHIIAWNSTHMVPIDEPEVIVDAIHEVVEDERRPIVNSRTP